MGKVAHALAANMIRPELPSWDKPVILVSKAEERWPETVKASNTWWTGLALVLHSVLVLKRNNDEGTEILNILTL